MENGLSVIDQDQEMSGELATPSAVEALSRAEIDMQIQTAKRYPRSMTKFQQEAMAAVSLSESVAAACIYAIPRDGKTIEGPTARFAEIVAASWGNIRVDCRLVDIGPDAITVRAMCIDLERNNGQAVEVRARITNKQGKRFNEDMIGVTAAAAMSKARRNAIFSVIPRAFVIPVLEQARRVAVGDAQTLAARRGAMLKHFQTLGVLPARVFSSIGVAGEVDITLDHLAVLKGYAQAIKDGEANIETCFPEANDANARIDALKVQPVIPAVVVEPPKQVEAPKPSSSRVGTKAKTPAVVAEDLSFLDQPVGSDTPPF